MNIKPIDLVNEIGEKASWLFL